MRALRWLVASTLRTLAGLVVVLGVVVGIARAQAIGGGGGGGGLSSSAADLLYCALAGCTMTGAVTISGVTNDITTGANEALRLRPNGTGRIILQSGDNAILFESASGSGSAFGFETVSGANTQRIGNGAASINFDGNSAAIGASTDRGAAETSGCLSESNTTATRTELFCGYGGGKF